ncbi:unnamed protein product [Ectocarpus sp. 4 AP-2014]
MSAAATPVACPQLFKYLGARWHALPREAQALLSSSEAEAATCAAVYRVRADRLAPGHQLEDEEDREEEDGIKTALASNESVTLKVATDLHDTEAAIAALQAKHALLTTAATPVTEDGAHHRCELEVFTGRRQPRLRDGEAPSSGTSSGTSFGTSSRASSVERDHFPTLPSRAPPALFPTAHRGVSYAAAARSPRYQLDRRGDRLICIHANKKQGVIIHANKKQGVIRVPVWCEGPTSRSNRQQWGAVRSGLM